MFAKHQNKFLILCLALLFILITQLLSSNAKLNEYKEQIIKFKDGEQFFTQKINDNGEKIAEQDQIILSQKDAIANNLLVIEDLKKIKSQVTIKTITKIDSF